MAVALAILAALPGACGRDSRPEADRTLAPAAPGPTFTHVARQAGIDFTHFNGATGEFYFHETHSSGAAFFDYDGDEYPDLYVVNGSPIDDLATSLRPVNALYRNRGDGTFQEVAAVAGVADGGYGMGVCAADYDNDGHTDLHVTNYGANRLYHNRGDGSFEDATERAGVGDTRLGTSSAFADYDSDGDLDLYVCNNVRISPDLNPECRHGVVRIYCGPGDYDGEVGILYQNQGDGTFRDVTRAAGLHTDRGRQLGVVWGDYDDDGDPDLYVANDLMPNFLFRNEGQGTFREMGLLVGVALSPDAGPEAGMGTDWGDYDRDGKLDLIVCNFQWESCRLLHNEGDDRFEDRTGQACLGGPTYGTLNFGLDLFDYDNDGYLDLFIANGHIEPNIEMLDAAGTTFAQHNQLFRNACDGTFTEMSEAAGLRAMAPTVSRGLATADYDNDGDVDVFVSNNNQPANLLRNDGGNRRHWIAIRMVGTVSNRSGIGTRVSVRTGDLVQVEEVRGGSSYLSQNDTRLHFGLGDADRVDRIDIRWPSGAEQRLDGVAVDQFLVVEEPGG